MPKTTIRPGQRWRSRTSGVILIIGQKASGNGHWQTFRQSIGMTHKIHEGTLRKFYDLLVRPRF